MRNKFPDLEAEFEKMRNGVKILDKQKGYSFPEDFPNVDIIASEWDSLNQIMTRKNKVLEQELPSLRASLNGQKKVLERAKENHQAEGVSSSQVFRASEPTK